MLACIQLISSRMLPQEKASKMQEEVQRQRQRQKLLVRAMNSNFKPYLPFFLFFILSEILPAPANSITDPSDIAALLSFKSSILPSSVPSWSCIASWNFSADPCSPSPRTHFICGITCSPDASRITALVLDPAAYVGPLSPSLANLTHLQHLDLSDNSFHGQIPSSIFTLPDLETLTLRSNFLSGSLPLSLSSLKSLQSLDISHNALAGALPSTLKLLTELRNLDLSFNRLVGTIPKLPPHISELAIKGNSLSGALRSSSFLDLNQLEVVELSGNNITGALGAWFFLLPSVQQVNLANNSLTRIEIPDASKTDSEIVAVDLGYNRIEGDLPANFARFPYISALSLRYNRFHGTIPSEFGKKGTLRRLFLDGNYLSGRVPAGFSGDGVLGSFGNNCLESCPRNLEMCSGAQKPVSVCRQAYRGRLYFRNLRLI